MKLTMMFAAFALALAPAAVSTADAKPKAKKAAPGKCGAMKYYSKKEKKCVEPKGKS